MILTLAIDDIEGGDTQFCTYAKMSTMNISECPQMLGPTSMLYMQDSIIYPYAPFITTL